MTRKLGLLLLLSALVGLNGCSSFRNYVANTVADASDVVRLDVAVGYGSGMGIHAMITKLVQVEGYSYENIHRLGTGPRSVGIWRESRHDWALSVIRTQSIYDDQIKLLAPSYPAMLAKIDSGPRGEQCSAGETWDEVGLGFYLFVVGARVGVRPYELWDLAVGLIGFDPCNDNLSFAERMELLQQRRTITSIQR
jgi:hypothetical protein